MFQTDTKIVGVKTEIKKNAFFQNCSKISLSDYSYNFNKDLVAFNFSANSSRDEFYVNAFLHVLSDIEKVMVNLIG